MDTTKLIEEVVSLPVEDRALIAKTLLETLNHSSEDIDSKWSEAAKERLSALKSGEVEGVPLSAVMKRLNDRFEK